MFFEKYIDMLPDESVSRIPIDLNGYSRMPHNLLDVVLRFAKNDISVHGWRIFWVILATVKTKQQFIQNSTQLDMFQKEFGDITLKTNSVQFSFLWKDFLPKGSRNYKEVQKGLQELTSYSEKHIFKNEIGQDITVISSIISDVVINKNQQGLKFSMNLVWYKMFLLLNPYNKFPNNLGFDFNSINPVVWYFYLSKRPPKSPSITGNESYDKNTKEWYGPISISDINTLFATNYAHWSKIEEKLLKPIRANLDKYADISFNYYKGEDKQLYIITYFTKGSVPLRFDKENDLRIFRALKYQKKTYALGEDDTNILLSLYKKYGYDDVYKSINRKRALSDKKGREYINEVHNLIQLYLKNVEQPG